MGTGSGPARPDRDGLAAAGASHPNSEQPMMLKVDPTSVRLSSLTPQERQCLKLVAQNRSSKEIALELGISKASVDTYCNRARAKLGVANRRAAARLVALAEPTGESKTAPVAPPAAPAPPTVQVSLLPPLERLGASQRLALILLGAIVLATAFGMLVTGLGALERFADDVRAKHAAPQAVSSERGR
jgi:DNA-binding CsgD family transcriptional regulator